MDKQTKEQVLSFFQSLGAKITPEWIEYESARYKSIRRFLEKAHWPKCGLSAQEEIVRVIAEIKPEEAEKILGEKMKEEAIKRLETAHPAVENQFDSLFNRVVLVKNIKAQGSLRETLLAIDPVRRTILKDINIEIILNHRKLSLADIKENPSLAKPYVVEFNPYTTDLFFETKLFGMNLPAINSYSPPDWMYYAKEHNVQANYPFEIKALVDHLFPEEEERKRVLEWCANALRGRNETALVLVGFKGTGKNLFMATIMGAIIGEEYTELVGQSTLDEKFNAAFHNKRLVVFDEVALTSQAAIDNFKRYCNNRISIEKKGIDAFTADNFSSIAILSNNFSSLGITMSDRRFSVPRITKERLDPVFDKLGINIDEMVRGIQTKQEKWMRKIAEFGKYLLEMPLSPNVATYQIAGEYFVQVAEASVPDWFLYLIDYIGTYGVEGTPVIVKEVLRHEYKDEINSVRKKTVQRYMSDHFYRRKYPIGTVSDVKDGRGRISLGIMPNPQFLKEYREDKKLKDPITKEETMELIKKMIITGDPRVGLELGEKLGRKSPDDFIDEDLL